MLSRGRCCVLGAQRLDPSLGCSSSTHTVWTAPLALGSLLQLGVQADQVVGSGAGVTQDDLPPLLADLAVVLVVRLIAIAVLLWRRWRRGVNTQTHTPAAPYPPSVEPRTAAFRQHSQNTQSTKILNFLINRSQTVWIRGIREGNTHTRHRASQANTVNILFLFFRPRRAFFLVAAPKVSESTEALWMLMSSKSDSSRKSSSLWKSRQRRKVASTAWKQVLTQTLVKRSHKPRTLSSSSRSGRTLTSSWASWASSPPSQSCSSS